MDESLNPNPSSNTQQGLDLFKKAVDLEKKGQIDLALTEYRRAVLADPNLVEAHMAVGRMCRQKGETDPIFYRFSFDSFQKAVHLKPDDPKIHDQYITASQKLGRLDSVLEEYDEKLKTDPENEILKRCRKNILSISLAMMPQQVSMSSNGSSKKLRKSILFFSLGGLLLGLILMAGPVVFRNNKNIKPEQMKNFFRFGFVLTVAAGGGLIIRNFIK